jgi:cytochrome b involved in lipid metabolism
MFYIDKSLIFTLNSNHMSSKILIPIIAIILILLVGVGVYSAFASLNPLKENNTVSNVQNSASRLPTNSRQPISSRLPTSKPSQTNPYQGPSSTPVVSAPANTPQTPAVNQLKTFTQADLSAKNTESDCYVAVLNKVYDVTAYIGQHPGGKDILKGCGKKLDGVKHPGGSFTGSEIQGILKEYYLGELR